MLRITRQPRHEMAAWQACAALFWGLTLGYYAFLGGGSVPLLSLVDLAIHEIGHIFFLWAPVVVYFAMGSGVQILVPLMIAAFQYLVRGRVLVAALALAWASESMVNASTYIADAPTQRLPLITGRHDWAFLLGPEHCGCLRAAAPLAAGLRGLAFLALLGSLAMAARALWRWASPAVAAEPV